MLENVTPAPPDAILGLTEAFKADTNPNKINLGVGIYKDDSGQTPIVAAVKEAEKRLIDDEATKSYFPINGVPEYAKCLQALLFGKGHAVIEAGRATTAHTPGGTGALRVGADLIKRFRDDACVWVSTPTWANHKGIFTAAGYEIKEYPYYDASTKGVDFDAMCETLKSIPAGDIVLMHVCCHNPTGADLSAEQWKAVAAIAKEAGWLPFLDFAYQGFGTDLEDDRAGVLSMLEGSDEMLIASSFSKNFGLYRERTGALTMVASTADAAQAVLSHAKKAIRTNYSNPPAHGGLIVITILNDDELRKQWEAELVGMCERIATMRAQFVAKLKAKGVEQDFSFIERQRGMFSFSSLSDEQVAKLRDEKSIYIVKGGRINVAGITSQNIDYLCDAIASVL